jgi:two-component system LytT family response regulator
MIKAIAIDDEKNALGIIREFCNRIPDIELTDMFTDPLKALPYISKNPDIELLFLDIQMTKLNGLVLAQHLPDKKTKIILTTAYPDYALQGYEMDVVDYLLKPFSFERFERSVQKARSVLNKPTTAIEKNTVRLTPGIDDFIFVKTDYKTLKVRLAEVLYIEGSGNYVTLHTSKSKIMALQNLRLFEEQLQPYQFIRIHKSYIISVNFIDAIEKSSVWIGNNELPIGESYKDLFKEFMNLNYKQF